MSRRASGRHAEADSGSVDGRHRDEFNRPGTAKKSGFRGRGGDRARIREVVVNTSSRKLRLSGADAGTVSANESCTGT